MSIADKTPATATNFNAAFASKSNANTFAEAQTLEKQLVVKKIAAPSSPASGYLAVYGKSDNELYMKNSSGGETKISNPSAANLSVTSVQTTTYPITTSDDVVLVSGASSAFTTTLFTAVGNSGKQVRIIRTDQTLANQITIATTSAQTIGGVTTRKLSTINESFTLVSDGSNWQILDHSIPSSWTSWTPTGSWSTNTTYTGQWRRIGDSIDVQVKVSVSGAPTSASLTINLPSGLTILESVLPNVESVLGRGEILDTSASTIYYFAVRTNVGSSGLVGAITEAANATYLYTGSLNATTPVTFASGDYVVFRFMAPITGWEG